MAKKLQVTAEPNRLLVKLRPSGALKAAESRIDLRPLHDSPSAQAAAFAIGGEPQWFMADLPEGADTPWDLAHARVADRLGVAESDVVFAEPDLFHTIYPNPDEPPSDQPFAASHDCTPHAQDGSNRKGIGPDEFAWHLGSDFTQLADARKAVTFREPRVRIAHVDTGYYPDHSVKIDHVLRRLERNFVDKDGNSGSAEDPDNRLILLDNSGHGTGTLSILAGGKVPVGAGGDHPATEGMYMGGAPQAEVVPLRIADSVVLFRTSAFAKALKYAVEKGCDVLTMSMGGLPTKLWEEEVDAAYERGLCICAAAGNHFGIAPPRTLVYPARYPRVIAVCGVMANGKPYDKLKGMEMEGCFGPGSAMRTAISAYTPNIPWALFRCKDHIRLNGAGTSSATPQVAAAAAIWLERYKDVLPRDWTRVEAVRHALFSSARDKDVDKRFGNGILQAHDALSVEPVFGLPKSKRSKSRWAFLRLITGLGIDEPPPREEMFNLELAQRWLVNPDLEEIVDDPEDVEELDEKTLKKLMDAIIGDDGASRALRLHVAARYPVATGGSAPPAKLAPDVIPKASPVCRVQPTIGDPPHRRLRVYAVDPSLSTRLATADINEVTLKVRWEALEEGPSGEYLRVQDTDASGMEHELVDLDHPRLLAQDGWAPAEGNPQFHQQMVYAVSMKTIEHFEYALGRPVLWRPRPNPEDPHDDSAFVKQLVIRPHAVHQANAYYSPENVRLDFGYFEAGADNPGAQMPGSLVYACLSHDIIAHETTHAILDGMYRRFNEPTNPDVLALHEAFSDIVALMQHFTIPEVLEREISQTRGDIEAESILGSLAVQFGRATRGRGALRDAIGHIEDGKWKRLEPDPAELEKRLTPHARGAVLVAAVFDAFIAIYKTRTADLLRIYTGGTGVLPQGAIHPDLIRRLAGAASKSAGHVLNMCIRALDYLPPVDVTFFEFLRALITADFDLVRNDPLNYRVAFVEAFRRRGIYPVNLGDPSPDTPRTLSVDTLRWWGLSKSRIVEGFTDEIEEQYVKVIDGLKEYANACFYLDDRKRLFDATREHRMHLHRRLKRAFDALPEFATELGLDPKRTFEVHELRRAMRIGPDGRHVPQVVVALTQSTHVKGDNNDGTPPHVFRGGSTLVVDLSVPEIKYRIVKSIDSEHRRRRTARFVRHAVADPLRALFFAPDQNEPFAALHALADDGF